MRDITPRIDALPGEVGHGMMEACRRCGEAFRSKRLLLIYCSRRCRVADAVARHRNYFKNQPFTAWHLRSDYRSSAALLAAAASQSQGFTTNFTEVLNGDDYPLDYYEDGYPKIPDCLDRRPFMFAEAA